MDAEGKIVCSDSEIVLRWLCSKKLPDTFVSKRIEEIKKNWRTNIKGDIALLGLTLLIFLAVELLLVPWLMNAAFGGRVLSGCAGLQICGLFGAVVVVQRT